MVLDGFDSGVCGFLPVLTVVDIAVKPFPNK